MLLEFHAIVMEKKYIREIIKIHQTTQTFSLNLFFILCLLHNFKLAEKINNSNLIKFAKQIIKNESKQHIRNINKTWN